MNIFKDCTFSMPIESSRREVLDKFKERLNGKSPKKEYVQAWSKLWTQYRAEHSLVLSKERAFPLSNPKVAKKKRTAWRLKYKIHAVEHWIPHLEGQRVVLRGKARTHTCTALDQLYAWRSELQQSLSVEPSAGVERSQRELFVLPEVFKSSDDFYLPCWSSVRVSAPFSVQQKSFVDLDGNVTTEGRKKALRDTAYRASCFVPRKRLERFKESELSSALDFSHS